MMQMDVSDFESREGREDESEREREREGDEKGLIGD